MILINFIAKASNMMIAASKCLHGHVDDLAFWLKLVYYTAFFGAIAWAFLRGGARSAIHLLRAAAILTLAIPLTTLFAWLMPGHGRTGRRRRLAST
jgi:hypothetical protein